MSTNGPAASTHYAICTAPTSMAGAAALSQSAGDQGKAQPPRPAAVVASRRPTFHVPAARSPRTIVGIAVRNR